MLCYLEDQTVPWTHVRWGPDYLYRVAPGEPAGVEGTDRLACDRMCVVERWTVCLDSHTNGRHRESSM